LHYHEADFTSLDFLERILHVSRQVAELGKNQFVDIELCFEDELRQQLQLFRHGMASLPVYEQSLKSCLKKSFADHAAHIALVQGERTFTYEQLAQQVKKVAALLASKV